MTKSKEKTLPVLERCYRIVTSAYPQKFVTL